MKTWKFALAALLLACLFGATPMPARAQATNTPGSSEPPPATEAKRQTDAVYNANVTAEYRTQLGGLGQEIRAKIADGKHRCTLGQTYDFADAVAQVEARLKALGYTVTHTDSVTPTDSPSDHHNYNSYHWVMWTISW